MLHHVGKSLDTNFYAQRIGCVQVLCDEETRGGESSEVDKQKRKIFSCGSSAFSKDVYIFEGLFGATVSFDCIKNICMFAQ
jgi:hypothetical protein